jgi:MFS transporter, DHA2 family, multidrug resistance protein
LATATKSGVPGGAGAGTAPRQAGLVLLALIVVAGVANLNLTVANVALPDIGRAFDTGQTALDLIAIGCSLGLAGSVLYLGRWVIATAAG